MCQWSYMYMFTREQLFLASTVKIHLSMLVKYKTDTDASPSDKK